MSAPLSGAASAVLRRTQRHLQAIYAFEAPDVVEFIVDKETATKLAPESRVGREAVLVSQKDDDAGVAVYIAPEIVERVASREPVDAVHQDLDAWSVTVEAVSHFLLLVHRAGRDEGVSLLELETQAEVDKFVTARLVAGRGPDLRARLFGDGRLAADLDAVERERYRTAGRLADGFCRKLDDLPHVDAVLVELRAFWRLSGHQRMSRLRRAA